VCVCPSLSLTLSLYYSRQIRSIYYPPSPFPSRFVYPLRVCVRERTEKR
jgi:hypothetical protein